MPDCNYSACNPCGPMPSWKDPPADKSVDCEDLTEEDTGEEPELEYDNYVTDPEDCHIEGSVTPEVTESYGPCGGQIIKIWKFEEDCAKATNPNDRKMEHVQIITVNYSDNPEWVEPPADLELGCVAGLEYIEDGPQELSYENHAEGDVDGCRVSGTATGYICAAVGYCSGMITQTWTADDECRRVIDHTQIVTTTAATQASWVNPPPSQGMTCTQAYLTTLQPLSAFRLQYKNNLRGPCKIEGYMEPRIEVNVQNCTGTITRTWEFTDLCLRTITHVQVLTVTPDV